MANDRFGVRWGLAGGVALASMDEVAGLVASNFEVWVSRSPSTF